MTTEIISDNPRIQEEYERMVEDGVMPKLAEMFALQSPPRIHGTDRVFNEGRCNGNQFEKSPLIGDMYAKEAKRAGVSISGKRYMDGLALYPGDPQAWVSDTHDVRRIVQEQGLKCKGIVNLDATRIEADNPKPPAIADDILEERADAVIEANKLPPGEVDRQELKEQIQDAIKPRWAK